MTIQQVISRHFSDRRGNIEKIEIGRTNEIFKYTCSSGEFAIRLNSSLMKREDRIRERQIIKKVQHITAPIIKCNVDDGYLITRWVPSEHIKFTDTSIAQLAKTLNKLHEIEYTQNEITSPMERIRYYESLRIKSGYKALENHDELISKLESTVAKYYSGDTRGFSLCHNDFGIENILQTKHEILLIDWEYAKADPKYFDYAMLIVRNDFTPEQIQVLKSNLNQWDDAIMKDFLFIISCICVFWTYSQKWTKEFMPYHELQLKRLSKYAI